ncbi:MAG: hypothetical protein R3B49_02815 [Phycisphaerales bacterium]
MPALGPQREKYNQLLRIEELGDHAVYGSTTWWRLIKRLTSILLSPMSETC